MIRNYFISAVRYFLRHRFFSLLNILGLAVGFASSLLLILFVWQEGSYDAFHEKGDRIARITMEYKYSGIGKQTAVTGSKVAPTFAKEWPEIESAVRFSKFPTVVKYNDKLFEEDKFLHADSTFFSIFSFELLAGNPNMALNGPNKVLITPETAQRYFGTVDPIGKTLLVDNQKEYEITGLIAPAPPNSQIKYDFIGSFSSLRAFKNESWFNANYYSYLLLSSSEAIKPLDKKLFEYMKSKTEETGMADEDYLTFHLEPLKDVHLHSALSGMEPNVDIRYIYIFVVVAILILFISAINYINLATARAVDRGTEVGIRKVLGAHFQQIFWQYINESLICVLLAALVAWLLASGILPFFNQAISQNYSLDLLLNPQSIGCIIAVLFTVTFGAGAYPALILARYSPSKTLKGKVKHSNGGMRLRSTLIIFQFVISAALIICSLVIYSQLKYLRTTNLGYQKDHIIVQQIDSKVVDKYDVLKAGFEELPQVEEITMAYETPTYINWGDGVDTPEGNSIPVTASPVDYNYLNTLNIDLIAGKDFSILDQKQAFSDSVESLNEQGRNIIMNAKAVELLGWNPEEAVGKRLDFKGKATVIGVIDNFHFAPLHEEIGPLILFVDNIYNEVMIRVKGDNTASTLALMAEDWKNIVPHIPFNPTFLNQEYNALYRNEAQLSRLFTFFTTLTIVLGCMGLLGLSALLISHRTQEIGIRKVLGASIGQIIQLLSYDFLKLVLISFLIAVPLAWYAMDKWLQTFVYRINMPWILFLSSGFLLLVIAFITLSVQSIKAAMRNPAEVIRND